MTDILALARSRHAELTRELKRIEAFLATADELMRGAPADLGADEAGAATVEPAPAVQQDASRPATQNKIPTDALFHKILSDQRAQRAAAAAEPDTIHFERQSA